MMRTLAISLALALSTTLALNGLALAQDKPAKPHSPPVVEKAPSKPLQQGEPTNRSAFCTGKPNGNYCGENAEPRLFRCERGFIASSVACQSGCDAERNRCRDND